MTVPARCELWVESRDGRAAVNPVLRALLDDLAGAGHRVTVRVPEGEVLGGSLPRPDLVLLKTTTTTALSWARVLGGLGVAFVNPAAATAYASDKAAVLARLAAAGLPVPRTYLRGGTEPVPEPPETTRPGQPQAPWVAKPVHGVHGWGVAVHPTLAAAAGAPTGAEPPAWIVDDGTRLVQAHVAADSDTKVYLAGPVVFAGHKVFSRTSFASDEIRPVALSAAQHEVAAGCAEALGLRLAGVDLRGADGRCQVIDVNPFPGYRGFPAAVAALRAEVDRALDGRQ